ncbi:MAG: dihydroorotase [Burkholderiales bacterium]|nr:MAG: dihydroorotase [Burkholderiales bacterium]TAG82327.1 MAG: dihydroorotase [Betaproteobacteria bacterium]
MTHQITLTRPDDFHVHLRDGEGLRAVVPLTASQFERALVMPNLKPPVTTVTQAEAYAGRIQVALEPGQSFTPLMTLYLTDNTPPDEIARVAESPVVHALKYYPAGATTNSDSGVTDLKKVYSVLDAMQKHGVVLCLHGEVTHHEVDVFDREAQFVDTLLQQIVRDFPALKVVVEHITTSEAADFVRAAGDHVAATITPQHLLYNRNAIFTGGIRPHFYCLPILKRETHRQSLIAAATSGSPKFFLGTDSAPHAKGTKENACGCAGCFTAHAAMELYAEAFETANALDKLDDFASRFGAEFYGLPRNKQTVTLTKTEWTPPTEFAFGSDTVVALTAGQTLRWKLS